MSKFNNYKITAYLLIIPQLLITLLFFIFPAINAVSQAFYFSDAFGIRKQFAGFSNFSDTLADGSFLTAIELSFGLSAAITILTMVLGLKMAITLQQTHKSRPIYKSFLLWPYAVAPAIAALLWRFICEPSIGWLPRIFNYLNYDFNYLAYPSQACLLIIIAASWQQFSYNFLFFYAALTAIPKEIIEAAVLDGASFHQRFMHIIFPLLSPTTFFLLTMNVIYGFFDIFGIIDVLTHGGPGNSTATLIYKIYKDGFINMDLGAAAVQSIILMLIVIGLTVLQFRYIEKRVHYR